MKIKDGRRYAWIANEQLSMIKLLHYWLPSDNNIIITIYYIQIIFHCTVPVSTHIKSVVIGAALVNKIIEGCP